MAWLALLPELLSALLALPTHESNSMIVEGKTPAGASTMHGGCAGLPLGAAPCTLLC